MKNDHKIVFKGLIKGQFSVAKVIWGKWGTFLFNGQNILDILTFIP